MQFLPSLDEYEDVDVLPHGGEHQCYMHRGDAFFHGTEKEFLAQLTGGGVFVAGANWYSHRDVLVPPFQKVEIANSSSSAGDWELAVFDGENWCFSWQENAWPSGGFRIGVDKSIGASTLDELYRCYDYV